MNNEENIMDPVLDNPTISSRHITIEFYFSLSSVQRTLRNAYSTNSHIGAFRLRSRGTVFLAGCSVLFVFYILLHSGVNTNTNNKNIHIFTSYKQ